MPPPPTRTSTSSPPIKHKTGRRAGFFVARHGRVSNYNVLCEHVTTILVTFLACFGAAIWLVAIATDYWIIVVAKTKELNRTRGEHADYLWTYAGLWRHCNVFGKVVDDVVVVDEAGEEEGVDVQVVVEDKFVRCRFHPFLSTSTDALQAALVMTISLTILMVLSVGFSVYSLFHPRYSYKRLAGALHFLTACSLIILMGLAHSKDHLTVPSSVLERSEFYYGYSYLLASTVAFTSFSSAVTFLCLSKKKANFSHDDEIHLR